MDAANQPQVIDTYRVETQLGSGAYADTYRVVDANGVRYALKLARRNAPADAPQRFAIEKWALSTLSFEAIPKLVGSGEWDERPFLVMTLAPGTSLQEVLNVQAREQAVMGSPRALMIAEAVLECLAYLQQNGVAHRDIKPDHIIVNDSATGIMVVDYGSCQGPQRPVDANTFWAAGTSRFSPPDKLKYPTQSTPSQDVFAVGVVLYLLLTNTYPWSVEPTQGHGHLEDSMRRTRPMPVHRVNGLVSKEVGDYVQSLLEIDDAIRPTPNEALNKLRPLRIAKAPAFYVATGPLGRPLRFTRLIRDSIHGDILLTEYEWEIIATPEFQRLRWLRQLGLANLVYPGAEHSRLSHSLGATAVTHNIMRRIEDRTGEMFEPEEKAIARIYALLHDLPHVALGHTFEDELGIFARHDENRPRLARLLLGPSSKLGEQLRRHSVGEAVLALFDTGLTVQQHSWVPELVTGPAGADVLDYVNRDSHYCGLDHRIDSAIFRHFTIGRPTYQPERHLLARLYGRHGFRLDAEFALESVLRERLGLFLKVYVHPAKVSAGCMAGKALWDVMSAGQEPRLTETRIEWLGDDALMRAIHESDRPAARTMADMLMNRQLYKPVYRSRALRREEFREDAYYARIARFRDAGFFSPETRSQHEAALAKKAGLKPHEVAIYCPAGAPGIQRVRQYVETQPGLPEIRDEVFEPHLRIYASHLALWTVYVFCPPGQPANTTNKLADAAETLFGLKNEITFERRQFVLEL